MLAAERGAAANTLAAYRRDLDSAEAIVGDLVRADRTALTLLAAAWSALAPPSVARKSSALRQFFAFARDENWRGDDPSSELPRPRARRPLPRLLDHAEIATLFAQAEEEAVTDRLEAVRMLTLLELLYGSGLRATELVTLTRGAVPHDAPFLNITGKGGQQRLVPVSTRSRQALSRWLALLPPAGKALFPSRDPSRAQPGAPVPAAARAGGPGRDRAREGQPACLAPCLCHAPA